MANIVDYSNIPQPPPDKLKTKYTCRQRRGEVLRIMLSMGHTDIPVTKLAVKYGVTHSQISHDKKALIEFISENYFKPKKLKSDAIAAKYAALKGAARKQDYATLNKISNDIITMGQSLGIIEKAPDKVEAAVTHDLGDATLGELLRNQKKKD